MTLDRVRAPYGFVPLSPRVVTPWWAPQVQHDYPLEGAISGRVELAVQAEAPLFVRGADGGFFRTPEKRFALPGSSVRGMLRNVLEIATFSRLVRVNDHRYGVRDLQDPAHYSRQMAEFVVWPDGKKRHAPLVSAGWLRRNGGPDAEAFPATIVPCSFAKIHYSFLKEIAQNRGVAIARNHHDRGFHPGRRQSAVRKYADWGRATRTVDVDVETILTANPPGKAPRLGSFGRVASVGGRTKGTLVFTGQPNVYPSPTPRRHGGGHPKQHDFVFHSPDPARALRVSAEIFQRFEFAHSDAGQQHRLASDANEEWAWWKKEAFDAGGDVPVFFLLQPDGKLRAFGLAMMFRLAADYSTRDAVENVQGRAAPAETDFARLIFGDVPLEGGRSTDGRHRGLKGRVSVGLGTLEGPARELPPVRTVLGSPKASFHPSYLEQGDGVGQPPRKQGEKPEWRTYMDKGVRARGWKRYRQHTSIAPPVPPPTEKVATTFTPITLEQGAYFRVPLRVHNLRPEELGALLWTLDFGGDPTARHGLGMAKSLGYGAVRIQRITHALTRVTGNEAEPYAPVTDADLDAARRAFEAYMEEQLAGEPGGWKGSRQLHELLTMARPVDGADLRHMRLDDPRARNEFVAAKDQGLVLEPAGAATWREPARTERRGGAPTSAASGAGPEQPVAWLRMRVDYSPGNGELVATLSDRTRAHATRPEAQALLTELPEAERQRLLSKRTGTFEIRVGAEGRRKRILALRVPE